MVPTLPARSNFEIIARHNGLGGNLGFILPVRARVGRTFEALALFLIRPTILGCSFPVNYDDEIKR